ncbi:MAG: hypothetical protein EHM24_28515, partial [Acidobacteria bacterium]
MEEDIEGVVPTGYAPPPPEPEEEDIPYNARPTEGYGYTPTAAPAEDTGPPLMIPRDEVGKFFGMSEPRMAGGGAEAPPRSGRWADPEGGPPLMMTPDEFFAGASTASRPGAFARGAAEGVIPGL